MEASKKGSSKNYSGAITSDEGRDVDYYKVEFKAETLIDDPFVDCEFKPERDYDYDGKYNHKDKYYDNDCDKCDCKNN